MPSLAEPSPTLLVHTAFFLVNAVVYASVGRRFHGSGAATGNASRARGMFVLWWYAIALTALASAAGALAGAVGYLHVPFHVATLLLTLLLLSVALCGLVYYLAFLFLGDPRLLLPLALGYAAFFAFAVYYVASGDATGVRVGRWSVTLAYANPPPGAFRGALFAFIVLPQVLGALGYASLLATTRDAWRRYRILLVSIGVSLWSVCTLLQGAPVLPGSDAFQVGVRATGTAAVLLVLAAYRPPAFVRRRIEDAAAGAMARRA